MVIFHMFIPKLKESKMSVSNAERHSSTSSQTDGSVRGLMSQVLHGAVVRGISLGELYAIPLPKRFPN
jgi:hypothetical protein